MVKLRDDVDGCGCVRCQRVDGQTLRRSLFGTLRWSGALVVHRPSILLVFLGAGLLQLLALFAPSPLAVLTIIFGVGGVFVGRGYIGVVGRDELADRSSSATELLGLVFSRFPSFVGAAVLIVSLLFSLGLFITVVLSEPVHVLLEWLGVQPFAVDVLLLVAVAAGLVYAVLKFWFVPEACFVGGYGPVTALKTSWRITTLRRRKAILLVVGFFLLLGVGVLLDTRFADPASPIALSVRYGETTVVLRSFGLSFAGGLRFVFDMTITALYSGVFVHQYVSSAFDR